MITDIDIHVEVVLEVDDDILDAMQRLVPQLSSSSPVPDVNELSEVVGSACTDLLVARDRSQGNRIVGSLTLAVFRIPTGIRAWVEDVVVDGSARGRGAGEALTRAALRLAHARGARTVELTSRPSREAANRLYRRLGFEPRETNVYRYTVPSGNAMNRLEPADPWVVNTNRLRLVPHHPADLLAIIDGVAPYEAESGLTLAAGLREFFTAGDISSVWLDQLRATTSPDPWTLGFAVVHRETSVVIGSCGFKGPEDDGVVEIAYGVAPGFQGHGYATEAAAGLIAFAAQHQGVERIRAHTAPEENPSTRVLEKNGFAWTGVVEDPDDGMVWRWERNAAVR